MRKLIIAALLAAASAASASGQEWPPRTTSIVLGLGYQFAAAGSVVYRKAKESGLGHELPTDWFTEDVHP